MKINRYILHRIYYSFLNKFLKRRPKNISYALGISSKIDKENNLHIPMIDYDINDFEIVYFDIIKLIKKFKLHDCFVYKTRKGFHAKFPYDLMDWDLAKKIIYSSKADWRFKSLADEYGRVVLRLAGKYKKLDITPFMIIKSPYQLTETQKEMGMNIILLQNSFMELHSIFPKKILLK